MTTLATRTDTALTVIDGEVVETAQTNPYAFWRRALIVLVAGSGVGTAWTLLHRDPYAGLSFALLIAAIALLAGVSGRYDVWERG